MSFTWTTGDTTIKVILKTKQEKENRESPKKKKKFIMPIQQLKLQESNQKYIFAKLILLVLIFEMLRIVDSLDLVLSVINFLLKW